MPKEKNSASFPMLSATSAARGQYALGHAHAAQVFGGCLLAHQDHHLALLGPGLGLVGEEHHLPGGRARRRRQAARDDLRILQCLRVEDRVQQVVQPVGRDTQQGRLLVDHALLQHLHGDTHHGRAGAFAIARLQHPQLALLDRELEVLHVLEALTRTDPAVRVPLMYAAPGPARVKLPATTTCEPLSNMKVPLF